MKSRRAGRPRTGKLKIRAARVAKLSPQGSVSEYAKTLGVSRRTILRWIREFGAPASQLMPGLNYNAAYTIERDRFVEWLTVSGHYKPPEEY